MLCVLVLLIYLIFKVAGEYDTIIQFIVYGYQVELTLFTFGTVYFISQICFLTAIKSISAVLYIPKLIKKKWYRLQVTQGNRALVNVLTQLVMNNHKKSLLLTNIVPHKVDCDEDVISLITAEVQDNFDTKIHHYRKLIDTQHYSRYALKKLAEICYNNTHLKQAEDYAIRALNNDDKDKELQLMLINIYARLEEWPKLVFIITQLQRVNSNIIVDKAKEIASYYCQAAKSYLQDGFDKEALQFLEYALMLHPINIEALTLFIELLTNIKHSKSKDILQILRVAFSSRPCFELAMMYTRHATTASSEEIYSALSSFVKPDQHVALFLALAAYLGLIERITELKESMYIIK